MGFYINPLTGERKEDWLSREGELVELEPGQRVPSLPSPGSDKVLVCLIDNRIFTAAGITYSQRELEAFTMPDDPRTKTWYLVPKEKLGETMSQTFLAQLNQMLEY